MMFVYALFAYGWFGTPMLLVWSWSDWIRKPKSRSGNSYCALGSLIIATASVLLFIGLLTYSKMIGGFQFYDPRLLQTYRIGLLVSLLSIVASLGGVWRRNPLRWLSPLTAVGTLVLWVCAAASE